MLRPRVDGRKISEAQILAKTPFSTKFLESERRAILSESQKQLSLIYFTVKNRPKIQKSPRARFLEYLPKNRQIGQFGFNFSMRESSTPGNFSQGN